MDGSAVQTYLSDILHVVSQSLLAPDIILLLAFIAYALFCIGSVIAEYFSERRHFTIVMPRFLADLMAAEEEEIPSIIKKSGLLRRQKIALLTVYDYRTLPGDALVALIRRLVNEEESRYDRVTGRNNIAARVSPMLGLMGTLIPLGPGIQALGKADTAALSSSLLVAFDTTVAGLVVAAVCLVVGKIRQNWYGNYMNALDSAMATMLQKIEDMRAEGKITIKEPSDYAFIFENGTSEAPVKSKTAVESTAPARSKSASGSAARAESAAPVESAVPAESKPVVGSSAMPVAASLPDYDAAPQLDATPSAADALPATESASLPGMGWLPPEVTLPPYAPMPDSTPSIQQPLDFTFDASAQPYGQPFSSDRAASAGYQAPLQGLGSTGSSHQSSGGWYRPQTHQGATDVPAYGADGRVSWGVRGATLGSDAEYGNDAGN